MLKLSIRHLNKIEDWNPDTLQTTLNELLEITGKKPAELFSLIRVALTFAPFSPALNLTMDVLGKDVTMARLGAAAAAI